MDRDNRYKEGIQLFTELYTGKRKKDRKAWEDYFHSEAFLIGYHEKDFAELMLEVVEEKLEEYPPCKEFLTELYIAYGLRWDGTSAVAEDGAAFDGIEQIEVIAEAGPAVTGFKKNDPAMREGFKDYRELLEMAPDGEWKDEALLRMGKLLDRYILHNISDRPIQNASQYELSWRHPKSIKLLEHFFKSTKLPDKAYRILWNHLRLDTATNGREKLLYGDLRTTVLMHVPELKENPRVSYKNLLTDFYRYHGEGRTDEERAALDAFFEREDVGCALMDEAFVEEQLLPYWITAWGGKYLLTRLDEFARTHADMPYVEQVLKKIDLVRGSKRIEEELLMDEQTEYVWGMFDFQKRAYVRQYLHTAFPMAYGGALADYLRERMPVSLSWGKGLIDPERGGLSPDQPVRIMFGADELSIRFHLKFIEYRWNDSPRIPSFPWQQLCKVEAEAEFWLLAPVASAEAEEYTSVSEELKKRLADLPVYEEDIPKIADCIADCICGRGEDEDLWCTVYREKEEQLFGCDIYTDGTLIVYENIGGRKKAVPGGDQYAPNVDTALLTGTRLLEELTGNKEAKIQEKQENPKYSLDFEWIGRMGIWPDRILIRRPYSPDCVLEETQVTAEIVDSLLREYLDGRIYRLVFCFGRHDLMFLKDKENHAYACFYFEHEKQDWYALVGMPEVYAVVDEKDVVYVPFSLGLRPNYQLHQNTWSIARQLTDIFDQIAVENPSPRMMMWSPQCYRFETKLRYHLAMRLYGGYPLEQAQNQIADRFYIPYLPVRMLKEDLEGNNTGDKEVLKDKAGVQTALYEGLKGQLRKLVLTWQCEETYQYIVLLQDTGRYRMVYMDDAKEAIEHLVFDVREYVDADGKKYRKETFLGKSVPGYLVHPDVRRIRDYLDMLISEIRMPSGILGVFGEFSYESSDNYAHAKEKYL